MRKLKIITLFIMITVCMALINSAKYIDTMRDSESYKQLLYYKEISFTINTENMSIEEEIQLINNQQKVILDLLNCIEEK